jgi:alginate O-acetyltransferase complex protein AlgI
VALNSFRFLLLFFPVVALGYRLLAQRRGNACNVWLLLASATFYAMSGWRNLCILALSILVNAQFAKSLRPVHGRTRPRLLAVGIGVNVAALCAFKYAGLSAEVWAGTWLEGADWALPLGMSFFTLQQIMYLVDSHEGLVEPHSWFEHALFVSFFPSITAGPITRARTMIQQFRERGASRSIDRDLSTGLMVFAIGLFKKCVLADSLGTTVDLGYGDPHALSHLGAWACSVGYSLQLYFDFSGYSDMALGAALILGFDLPWNFDAPYRARSISEFWQRWHITLSRFITTYLFTPLVRCMGRVSLHKAAFAIVVAMLIAGAWHGASLNYIVFGALHGVALALYQYWKKLKWGKLPGGLGWGLTMLLVNTAFIFFRASTLGDALAVCRLLLPGGFAAPGELLAQVRVPGLVSWPLALLIVAFGRPSSQVVAKFAPRPSSGFLATTLLLAAILFMNSNLGRGFVYAGF